MSMNPGLGRQNRSNSHMADEENKGTTKGQALAICVRDDSNPIASNSWPALHVTRAPSITFLLQPVTSLKPEQILRQLKTLQYLSQAFRITKTQTVNVAEKMLSNLALTSFLDSSNHSAFRPHWSFFCSGKITSCLRFFAHAVAPKFNPFLLLIPHHRNTCTHSPQLPYPSGDNSWILENSSGPLLHVLGAHRYFLHNIYYHLTCILLKTIWLVICYPNLTVNCMKEGSVS